MVRFRVTWNPDGGTVTPAFSDLQPGVLFYFSLPIPVRTGWTFDGWFTGINGSGTRITNLSLTPGADTTYYAKWMAVGNTSFETALPIAVNTSVNVNISESNQRRFYVFTAPSTGKYRFVGINCFTYYLCGWLYSYNRTQLAYNEMSIGNGIVNFTFDYDLIAGEQYYFAAGCASGTGNYIIAITAAPDPVRITWDPGGGKVTPAYSDLMPRTPIGILPVPTRIGYTFNGWYTKPNGSGSQIVAGHIVPKGNITYYAKWTTTPLPKLPDPDPIEERPDEDLVKLHTVHGYVSEMVTLEWESGFFQMHDVVVELRATYKTPAAAGMSTIASLIGLGYIGEFTIRDVPVGDYVLVINRPGCIVRCMNITISPLDPDVVELAPPDIRGDNRVFNLLHGDCNGDSKVDYEDYLMVLHYMDQEITMKNPPYFPACDFNADGRVDIQDLLMLMRNMNRSASYYAGAEEVDFSN
jgi:uncharacterized repeat protein (TIGR02543 family)